MYLMQENGRRYFRVAGLYWYFGAAALALDLVPGLLLDWSSIALVEIET